MQASYYSQLTFSKFACLIYLFCFYLLPAQAQSDVFPKKVSLHAHPKAHAHNDYEHDYPLWDALSHGFNSVEADVWLVDDKLYVKHDKPLSLKNTPTLEELYLAPLHNLIKSQGGRVYPKEASPFLLMIDIKSQDVPTYNAIKKAVSPYREYLIGANPPLQIFLSGNRPIDYALKDETRIMGIDGRPEDLGKNYSSEFMPVISQRFSKIIHWNGKTPISPEDFNSLKELADTCHAEGKKLRLWASPETQLCWNTLLKAGVDLINTDLLTELDAYLQALPVKE